jgi:hypothetical protein
MKLKKTLLCLLLAMPLFVVVGCDSNPTNAPSQAEIDQAKTDQIAAIDKDPSMTEEDKQRLKQAKGLVPGGPPGYQGESAKGRNKG